MQHSFKCKNNCGCLFFIARPINKMNNKYLKNLGPKGIKLAKHRTNKRLRANLKNPKLF